MKNIEYTDLFNKKTYLVPEDKKALLEVYKNRYAIVLALTVLFRIWIENIFILIGFGVVLALFLEFTYRKKFLNSLTQIPYKEEVKAEINKQALVMNTVLYSVFASFLLYYAITDVFDYTRYIFIAITIFAYGLAISYLLETTKK